MIVLVPDRRKFVSLVRSSLRNVRLDIRPFAQAAGQVSHDLGIMRILRFGVGPEKLAV